MLERVLRRTMPALVGAALAAAVPAAPAGAQESLAVSYGFAGALTAPPVFDGTFLHLDALWAGVVTPANPVLNARWNPVTLHSHDSVDVSTGLSNGSFQMTFATGDILFGDWFEDVTRLSAIGEGPFTQRLTVLGGTGQFAGATGLFTGAGVAATSGATVSGTGRLTLAPEPAPVGLLGVGLVGLMAYRRRERRS